MQRNRIRVQARTTKELHGPHAARGSAAGGVLVPSTPDATTPHGSAGVSAARSGSASQLDAANDGDTTVRCHLFWSRLAVVASEHQLCWHACPDNQHHCFCCSVLRPIDIDRPLIPAFPAEHAAAVTLSWL